MRNRHQPADSPASSLWQRTARVVCVASGAILLGALVILAAASCGGGSSRSNVVPGSSNWNAMTWNSDNWGP